MAANLRKVPLPVSRSLYQFYRDPTTPKALHGIPSFHDCTNSSKACGRNRQSGGNSDGDSFLDGCYSQRNGTLSVPSLGLEFVRPPVKSAHQDLISAPIFCFIETLIG